MPKILLKSALKMHLKRSKFKNFPTNMNGKSLPLETIPCRLFPSHNPHIIFLLTQNNIMLLSNKWPKILFGSALKMHLRRSKIQNFPPRGRGHPFP